MEEKTINFIIDHASDDTATILLGASKYPEVDIPTAARCIEARKKLRFKVPSWYSIPSLEYPFPLALEQCSSEATAIYKQRFVSASSQVADLTGGMGIDSYFFSRVAVSVDYFERNPLLSDAAKSNFRTLEVGNIFVYNNNITVSTIDSECFKQYDLIFLDPARRDKTGSKIYSIADCEPNILELKQAIFKHTDRILVKISPMADISAVLELLPETAELHVVSVENECKELLLLMQKNFSGEPIIHAVNLPMASSDFTFTLSEERECLPKICSGEFLSYGQKSGLYLFEPNRSILKSGAFKLTAQKFGIFGISASTHLYIGTATIPEFPGKRYRLLEISDFSKRSIRALPSRYPAASVTARNFPLTSDQLRSRLHLPESPTTHIFATSTSSATKLLLIVEHFPQTLNK